MPRTDIRIGEYSYGIAPGEAVSKATLRTAHDKAVLSIDAADARAISTAAVAGYGFAATALNATGAAFSNESLEYTRQCFFISAFVETVRSETTQLKLVSYLRQSDIY